MKRVVKLLLTLIILCTVVSGAYAAPGDNGIDELDLAIRDVSDYLNDTIPRGSKTVFLNLESNSDELSGYIIGELIANAETDRVFSAVNREQLDAIRVVRSFELSDALEDAAALEIGRFFDAHTIVSGAVNRLGTGYRLRVRARETETGQAEGEFTRNIASSPLTTSIIEGGVVPSGSAAAHGGDARPSSNGGSADSPAAGSSGFVFNPLAYSLPLSGGDVLFDAGLGLAFTSGSGLALKIPPIFVNGEYALRAGVPISVGGFVSFYQFGYYDYYTYTYITFGGRGNWHWNINAKWLDLYTGLFIGYTYFNAGDNNTGVNYGGFAFGGQVGAHFYFTEKAGAVVEVGYPFPIKAGIALKF